MRMNHIIVGGLAAVTLWGCSTVRRAKEVQAEHADKGLGVVAAEAPKLDLRGYSLRQLVGFALTNRPSVVAARLDVERARLQLKALAAEAPVVSETPWTAASLSGSAAYGERSAGTTFRDHDWKTKGDPSAGLSLNLLLWDFGRYDASARAQAEQVTAAEQRLVQEGFAVFDEVTSAYFLYLERCALHQVALKNEREYADHLRRAEERLGAGEAQKLDVLKAKLDLAQATEKVVAASNLVATSGATLTGALGVDASRGTCTEVLGPAPQGLDTVFRGFARTDFGVEDTFAFARTNAPALKVARAQLRSASASVDAAVADLMPRVSASVGLSWTDPLWAWNWGVDAVQTIFQGFRKTTAVDQAVVALQSAAAGVDRAEQELSLALEVAIANRDNSVKAIETAMVSVESARQNLEMVRQQLQVGSVSRIELSEAISAHSSALGSCISAFYAGQVAEAKLFGLIGLYPVYREEKVTAHR